MRFRCTTRVVKLSLEKRSATYDVERGWCEIPDAACVTYRASIDEQIASGALSPRGKLPWEKEIQSDGPAGETPGQATSATASSADAEAAPSVSKPKRGSTSHHG